MSLVNPVTRLHVIIQWSSIWSFSVPSQRSPPTRNFQNLRFLEGSKSGRLFPSRRKLLWAIGQKNFLAFPQLPPITPHFLPSFPPRSFEWLPILLSTDIKGWTVRLHQKSWWERISLRVFGESYHIESTIAFEKEIIGQVLSGVLGNGVIFADLLNEAVATYFKARLSS